MFAETNNLIYYEKNSPYIIIISINDSAYFLKFDLCRSYNTNKNASF